MGFWLNSLQEGERGIVEREKGLNEKWEKKYYHITLGVLRTKIKRGVFLKIVCKMKNEKNYYITIFFLM